VTANSGHMKELDGWLDGSLRRHATEVRVLYRQVPIYLFFGRELRPILVHNVITNPSWMQNCWSMPTYRTHAIKQFLQLCKLILLVHGVFHLNPKCLAEPKFRFFYIQPTKICDFNGSSKLLSSDLVNQTSNLDCNDRNPHFISCTNKWWIKVWVGSKSYFTFYEKATWAGMKATAVAVSGTFPSPACLVRHSQGRHIHHD
jgi:hypothetical protein